MKLLGQMEDQVDVRLSIEELILLRNALNEFCNGMHFTENDFQAILDSRRSDVEALLLRLSSAVDRFMLHPE
jgi:hypothetical protein